MKVLGKFGLLLALAFTLEVHVSALSAIELKSGTLNYSVTVPDGWSVQFQNSSGFSIVSSDKKETVTLMVTRSYFGALDRSTAAAVERSFHRAGMTIISSTNFTLAGGVPVYQTVQSMGNPPFLSTFLDKIISTDGQIYDIGALHIGGQVTEDADVERILASFHFLNAPAPAHDMRLRFTSMFSFLIIVLVGAGLWKRMRRR